MNKSDIISVIQSVVQDIFDNTAIVLTEDTKTCDIEGFDSLISTLLIVGIENKFRTKFTSKEMLLWGNFGELADIVMRKLK